MEVELERDDDAEVAAAAANGPEELGVLPRARMHQLAVRGHDVGRDQVVDRHAEGARQPAEAAAEGEARDPGRRVDPGGKGEAEGLRLLVDVAESGARAD